MCNLTAPCLECAKLRLEVQRLLQANADLGENLILYANKLLMVRRALDGGQFVEPQPRARGEFPFPLRGKRQGAAGEDTCTTGG